MEKKNLLEKQAFKILAYVFFLFILIRLSIFTNLNMTAVIAILAFINPFFIIFILKTQIKEYKDFLASKNSVAKLQFELEFKIYTEIFDLIYNLNLETNKLAPKLDSPITVTEKKKRLENFKSTYNSLSVALDKHKPFYLEEIYVKGKEIKCLCNLEAQALEKLINKKAVSFPYKDSQKRKEKINENLDEVTALIKNRIVNMGMINHN